jgi:HEAT repeat protein
MGKIMVRARHVALKSSGSHPQLTVMKQLRCVFIAVVAAVACTSASGQQLRFDDVVRNLRNPDAKARLSAVRLLRDAKYPEAITPMAPLVNDPLDEIQMEAIAAELSFFVGDEVKSRRMLGFVVERRNPAVAGAAFDLGPAVVWPRTVPPELTASLIQAIDDDNAKVRLEATYALGVVGRPPLPEDQAQRLTKALDHYDPAVRAAAARVVARLQVTQAGDVLLKAINDSHAEVRYAAMRALGMLHETRAVAPLTEQLAFYKKGEGAWSALDALARLAQPTSAPLFKERLTDKDPNIRRAAAEGLGRLGDKSAIGQLESGVTADESEPVRIAMAFALQKLGGNYVTRIVDAMDSARILPQAEEYLFELGPSIAPSLYPRLQETDATIREGVAEVLGMIGDEKAIQLLQSVTQDHDANVANAAKRAIERIKSKHGFSLLTSTTVRR